MLDSQNFVQSARWNSVLLSPLVLTIKALFHVHRQSKCVRKGFDPRIPTSYKTALNSEVYFLKYNWQIMFTNRLFRPKFICHLLTSHELPTCLISLHWMWFYVLAFNLNFMRFDRNCWICLNFIGFDLFDLIYLLRLTLVCLSRLDSTQFELILFVLVRLEVFEVMCNHDRSHNIKWVHFADLLLY